ncbi:hydantoinase/oxoprolinase family protein [Rhodococcoides yunnanense]|uniref:hydantoinase/oxoprolinase family protein n=1 Tax=Rhodococcoides yunnanense TaxID=278209 RepID=UPI00093385B5|nr:hydantoinase/oxoprolinase family protein [Rhodococcus yunnanensis]
MSLSSTAPGPFRVGVDAGGTFTDICAIDATTGQLYTHKVSSTPADPSSAVVQGVAELLTTLAGTEWAKQVEFFAHGSTVATNALLEKKGAKTALITTAGFRDLLEIARQRRPSLYDLTARKPETLVKRRHRFEVDERLDYNGNTLRELDEAEVRSVVEHLAEQDLDAVAICFLYSYVDPKNEQFVADILAEIAPHLFVSTSHEVIPEFREYERMSTTVLNSYVGPVVSKYLENLRSKVQDLGIDTDVHITQSNGGIISLETAKSQPARMMLSGPSTGLVAATHIGSLIGEPNMITFDMGGTSTDAALIHDGTLDLAQDSEVDGYPLRTPMLDITTVGAGGGSIAWIDSGGALKVGPQSAGADPGPACYGRQDEHASVTDANVVLQTQNPTHLLGGRLPIDAEASRTAVGRLASTLGLDVEYVADGIIRIVTANMAKAIRVISVQRGHDPRDYVLTAFGGAGPLHAARLARELSIPKIIVPPAPGVMCAYGLMVTDLRTDLSLTKIVDLHSSRRGEIEAAVDYLTTEATRWFEREDIAVQDRQLSVTADMRYAGQNYEISVEMDTDTIDDTMINAILAKFEAAHQALYGYTVPDAVVQAVTFRSAATGKVVQAATRPAETLDVDASGGVVGSRPVYFGADEGRVDTPIYDRAALVAGQRITGPAVIEQMDSTTVVLPGQHAHIDAYANIVIEENK